MPAQGQGRKMCSQVSQVLGMGREENEGDYPFLKLCEEDMGRGQVLTNTSEIAREPLRPP